MSAMRHVRSLTLLAVCTSTACASPPAAPTQLRAATPTATSRSTALLPAKAPASPATERLQADTARTTARGNPFVAPKNWKIALRGDAVVLEAPEAGSVIAIVDAEAKDAVTATAAAWTAYGKPRRAIKMESDRANREGWRDTHFTIYQTLPSEEREVTAIARRGTGDLWTVVIEDVSTAVAEKRLAQIELVNSSILPKGFERESFAGKKARPFGAEQQAELERFVTKAQRELGIPGISVGVVQDGKVAFAGGFGVRELGRPAKVDENTLYIVGSNTKSLTTLMLAKLVDEGKFTWETPVTALMPSFALGDADATKAVQVQHLVCACTGLPRRDLPGVFQFQGVTAKGVVARLANVRPTSKFGEMFQYSNTLAAVGGYVGGHVAYPELELGAAYDKVMQTRVFTPLGMTATTLDYALAFRRNPAVAHAPNFDGKPGPAERELNKNVINMRPAGGAWSNVRDMLKYVAMELAKGTLPNGKRYIAESPLLARRLPRASVGKSVTYGMGLMVEELKGVTMVYHGGDNVGYHSDVLWLPEHGAGAVILMNGDPGGYVRYAFRRKLLELLFDGRKEADAWVSNIAKGFFEDLASRRRLATVPADAADAAKLATTYANDELGEITIRRDGQKVILDVGEWKSELASRRNADGTVSFRIIEPGIEPFDVELVASVEGNKRKLTLHEAQEKYVFVEK